MLDDLVGFEKNFTVVCKTLQVIQKPLRDRELFQEKCNKLQAFQDRSEPDNTNLLSLQQLINTYARENIALVTVFIRDPYAAHYLRDEKVHKQTFCSVSTIVPRNKVFFSDN